MFVAKLEMALSLRADGHAHAVAGNRIKACTLELLPHGFFATVTFWNEHGTKDDLIAWFATRDLIEAELTLAPAGRPESAARVALHGLVADRSFTETVTAEVKGAPVQLREYTVRLVDAAELLWRQHFPLELRAQAKMKELIAAQLAEGIKLDITLDDAERTRPLLCIATDERTSFYDVVVAYAEQAGGAFHYDYYDKTYRLAAARKSHDKKPKLRRLDVAALRVILPETIRHGARVLNGHTEAAQIASVTAPAEAVAGIARDRLIRTPRPADVDDEKQLQAARLKPAEVELEVEHARLGDAALMPGATVALDGDFFSGELHAAGKGFRVCRLSLSASVADGGYAERKDNDARAYQMSVRARWESAAETRPRLPPHAPPAGPLYVEGKIVADGGGAQDRIFMSSDDQAGGQSWYVVHVPLWNQKIKVPFQPHFAPGHFFAPAFKGSRVLLALHFDHAEILQFLDWGPDVQLPGESQGNHLLFGKNAKSQTSLKHVYVDDKPVLSLSRVAQADHGRLQLEEGTLVLEVREDPGASSAGETHDLSADVASGQEQVASGAAGAQQKLEGATQKGSRLLDGKVGAARSNVQGALDSLSGELTAKTAAGKGELEARLGSVDNRVAELQGAVAAALGDLQAKRGA
jgi:hypothetical protein